MVNIPKFLQIDSLKKAYILSWLTVAIAASVWGILWDDSHKDASRETPKIEQVD